MFGSIGRRIGMEWLKMEYEWLKIRFEVQKYKTVIIVLCGIFGLMALIYYGVRGMIPQMPVEDGSFSALLGALVGGFFSLAGSIGVAKILLYGKSIASSSVPLRSCTIDAQSSNFILRSCAFL